MTVNPLDDAPRTLAAAGRVGRVGRPAALAREQVLTCALQVVDDEGLEALSMRRLGAELGVDPMAVHRHMAGKAALLDGLVERVYAAVDAPPRTGAWKHDIRAQITALRRTLLAHPRVVPLLATRPPATPAAFTLLERAVMILLDAGLAPQQAADGVDLAARMVIGHVLAEATAPPATPSDDVEDAHVQAQQSLPADHYPALATINAAGVRHDPDRLFDLAVEGLIRTLQALLHSSRASPRTGRGSSSRTLPS